MISHRDLVIETTENVYEPREDSFLIADNLKVKKGESVLEIGTGSGILAILAAKRGGKVTAIDLNEDAIECAKKNWENNKGLRNQGHRGSETKTRTEPLKSVPLSPFINFIVGNLFAPVKGEKFDLIIFNPPYLPKEEKYTEKKIDLSYNSAETLERFLKEYKKHLNKNGRALIINSSISGVKVEGKVIAEKKLAFEKLEVIMLQ